jgi:hypothetical protein
MPDLSVIIVNWNTRQLLLDCIASIVETTTQATFEVIVVDNGSSDGSIEAVAAEYPEVTIIANKNNAGFSRANNTALGRLHGDYAVLLNSDTIMTAGALDNLFAFMKTHASAGICGPRLLNKDGTDQTSVGHFPTLMGEFINTALLRVFAPSRFREIFSFMKKLTGASECTRQDGRFFMFLKPEYIISAAGAQKR